MGCSDENLQVSLELHSVAYHIHSIFFHMVRGSIDWEHEFDTAWQNEKEWRYIPISFRYCAQRCLLPLRYCIHAGTR